MNPLGLFLRTSTPFIWRECLPTLLNPLVERACFSQARRVKAHAIAVWLVALVFWVWAVRAGVIYDLLVCSLWYRCQNQITSNA